MDDATYNRLYCEACNDIHADEEWEEWHRPANPVAPPELVDPAAFRDAAELFETD